MCPKILSFFCHFNRKEYLDLKLTQSSVKLRIDFLLADSTINILTILHVVSLHFVILFSTAMLYLSIIYLPIYLVLIK